MNPLTDPNRQPPGLVPITCTDCGQWLAWCNPPPPPVPVRCSDCPAEPGTLRALRPVLCAHADDDGAGAHWLRPGERCERATDG
jgi:hypothetical protein